MFIRFVGDIHGDVRFLSYLDKPIKTIQVGDFNLYGYENWYEENGQGGYNTYPYTFKNKILMTEGNHENYKVLNTDALEPYEVYKNIIHIPRGYVSGKTMFIGGADSIDKMNRVPGVSWFKEEIITSEQMDRIFAHNGPIEVIVSHDCPNFVLQGMKFSNGGLKQMLPCSLMLEDIFYKFRPKLWVHGHFHQSFDHVREGCRFVGLNCFEEKEFDIPVNDNLFDF